jgi:hypothetical protein
VRRLVTSAALLAAIALPAGSALATSAPPDTEPAATVPAETGTDSGGTAVIPATEAMTTAAPGTESAGGGGATAPAAVPVFDDSGNQVASIAPGAVELAWADYPEGDEPDSGKEYVRVIVTVESQIPDGTFEVSVDDFILQDNNGFVTEAQSIKTAEQSDNDEDVTTEADLGNGEAVELALTFEVTASVGPQSVFYSPDDDRLVDVLELG